MEHILQHILSETSRTMHWLYSLPGMLTQSEQDLGVPATNALDNAIKSATTVLTYVIVAVGLLAAVFIGLKIWNEVKAHNLIGVDDDDISKARKYEKKGEFVLAASYYEKANNYEKAIELYKRGRDFARAGALYEMLQNPGKAMEMYKRSGEANKIAGMHMKAGNYLEAAKLFKSKGDTLRAAQAFEQMGNHAAAAREYSEAGKHVKAAKLFKEAEMYLEAGQAFHKSFEGAQISKANISQHFTYAAFMVMAEQLETAKEVYRRILDIDPDYKDVKRKLRLLEGGPEEVAPAAPAQEAPPEPQAPSAPAPEAPPEPQAPSAPAPETPAAPAEAPAASKAPAAPAPEAPPAPVGQVMDQNEIDGIFDHMAAESAAKEAEEDPSALQNESTLRSLIRSGHLEPQYSLRIWMQILKQLDSTHSSGNYLGCIAPESIFIDMENNVRVEKPGACDEVYTAPEVREGSAPDVQSDVYAMGVVLYEMITGTTETIGSKYPVDFVSNLPEWLDQLIMRSIEQDPGARLRDIDEVSSIVLTKSASW
jgi:tetratricopeptide (TPR) repeat protein